MLEAGSTPSARGFPYDVQASWRVISVDDDSKERDLTTHGSVTITKSRRRARRARRTRSVDAGTGLNGVAPRARHGVATAPPRQPTGWHGQWSALDDRIYGPEGTTSRKRLVKPVHAVVGFLLVAVALVCFVIVNRGGDTGDQFYGATVTPAAPVSQPGVAVPSPG